MSKRLLNTLMVGAAVGLLGACSSGNGNNANNFTPTPAAPVAPAPVAPVAPVAPAITAESTLGQILAAGNATASTDSNSAGSQAFTISGTSVTDGIVLTSDGSGGLNVTITPQGGTARTTNYPAGFASGANRINGVGTIGSTVNAAATVGSVTVWSPTQNLQAVAANNSAPSRLAGGGFRYSTVLGYIDGTSPTAAVMGYAAVGNRTATASIAAAGTAGSTVPTNATYTGTIELNRNAAALANPNISLTPIFSQEANESYTRPISVAANFTGNTVSGRIDTTGAATGATAITSLSSSGSGAGRHLFGLNNDITFSGTISGNSFSSNNLTAAVDSNGATVAGFIRPLNTATAAAAANAVIGTGTFTNTAMPPVTVSTYGTGRLITAGGTVVDDNSGNVAYAITSSSLNGAFYGPGAQEASGTATIADRSTILAGGATAPIGRPGLTTVSGGVNTPSTGFVPGTTYISTGQSYSGFQAVRP